jgi:hypothetical protein
VYYMCIVEFPRSKVVFSVFVTLSLLFPGLFKEDIIPYWGHCETAISGGFGQHCSVGALGNSDQRGLRTRTISEDFG